MKAKCIEVSEVCVCGWSEIVIELCVCVCAV